LSAIGDLIHKARAAARLLSEKGFPLTGVELSELVGLARAEYNARQLKRFRLAKYHEKRATECDGPTRQFHQDAAELLRERDS
jgi:hypothetical protein